MMAILIIVLVMFQMLSHYCTSNIPDVVTVTLKSTSKNVIQWFRNNGMKANIDICHFVSSHDVKNRINRLHERA